MITLITERQLAADQLALWKKALQSVQTKNYKYAVTILKTIVKRVPGFLEGRKLLRACEVKSAPEAGRKASLFGGLRVTTTRRDPESVLVNIEDELERDPYSIPANEALFAAANELNLPDIAAFAMETICQGNPSNKKYLHLLAKH